MAIKRLTNSKQREGLVGIKTHILSKKTPEQINNYIDNNVTDLASAKEVLKKIANLLIYILKINNL